MPKVIARSGIFIPTILLTFPFILIPALGYLIVGREVFTMEWLLTKHGFVIDPFIGYMAILYCLWRALRQVYVLFRCNGGYIVERYGSIVTCDGKVYNIDKIPADSIKLEGPFRNVLCFSYSGRKVRIPLIFSQDKPGDVVSRLRRALNV